jgi:hypothetical protein
VTDPSAAAAAAAAGSGPWRAVAAFQQGERHRRDGLPCQDYAAVRAVGDLLVGVAADGAGSADRSRLGATLAVRSILACLTERLTGCLAPPLPGEAAARGAAPAPDAKTIRACFDAALATGLSCVRGAARARAAAAGDLACTVLALAATPHWVAALQLGDGLIVVRHDAPAFELMFAPQLGEYVNETRFLTDPDGPAQARFRLSRRPPAFVCLATDGLAPVSIDLRARRPHGPFFGPIETYLRGVPDAGAARQAAREFLRSGRLAQRSDDDRSLLLAVRLDAGAGAGAAGGAP